jgi:hypothetical protein
MKASDPVVISAEHTWLDAAKAVDVAPSPMTNERTEQMKTSAFGMIVFL